MPYATVKEFKDTAITALQGYCDDYVVFAPTHNKEAKKLLLIIAGCQTKEHLLDVLYVGYCRALKLKSVKLAKALAYVIGIELNIPRNIIDQYHYIRKDPTLRIFKTDSLGNNQAFKPNEGLLNGLIQPYESLKWDRILGYIMEFSSTDLGLGLLKNKGTYELLDPVITAGESVNHCVKLR